MVRIWIEDWGKMKHEMRQRWTTSTKPSHPIQKTRHATNVKRPRGIVDFCFLLSNLKSLLTHFHYLIIFFLFWDGSRIHTLVFLWSQIQDFFRDDFNYINHLKYNIVDNWTHSCSLTLAVCYWEFCCLDKFEIL